jgi:hypothetical protein
MRELCLRLGSRPRQWASLLGCSDSCGLAACRRRIGETNAIHKQGSSLAHSTCGGLAPALCIA